MDKIFAINIAYAADSSLTISQLLGNVESVLRQSIGILFVLATVVFLWGVIQYVIAGGDEDKIKTANDYIVWGLVGLFVMLTMWGIVYSVTYLFFPSGGSYAPSTCT